MLAPETHASRSGPEQFVGRAAELRSLVDDLAGLPHPLGPVRILRGVAGVGKTRLAEEFTRRAGAAGVTVVWGHNPDTLTAPPYWPWTQVVRALLGRTRGTDLASMVLDDPTELNRFELFDATTATVRRAAESGPLVIVLDDLHAADLGTLQLTRFLARHLADAPILLVATVRTGGDRGDELDRHLAALARFGHERNLSGLGVEAVEELLADRRGHAGAVHAITGGNPLHVHEIVRALPEPGPASGDDAEPMDLDQTLRMAVRRRILAVTGTTRAVLDAAAVLGHEFDRRELAALVEPVGRTDLEGALAGLMADGFLASADPGRFGHYLVSEAVLLQLPVDERHRLHRRAAAVIGTDDDRVGEAAHHLLRAGPDHRHHAVTLSRRAGTLATKAAAHEDAVDHLTRALDAIDRDPSGSGVPSRGTDIPEVLGVGGETEAPGGGDRESAVLRLDVLIDLGAALWRAGRTVEADQAYEAAWVQGVALGDPDSLARAVLRNGVDYYFAEDARPTIAPRVEQALAARSPEPSPTTARLLAELATHHLGRTVERGRDLAEQAVVMARGFEDPLALGNALIARQVTDLGPSTLARRVADGHEILACARDARDHRLAVHGRFLLMVALLEAGDIAGIDGELRRYDGVTSELGEPRYDRFALWLRATRAMLAGDVATAQSLADQTLEISARLGDPDAFGVHGGQIGVCRWMQGRVMETEPLYAAMRAAEPHEPLWPAVLAWLNAGDGQVEAARGALAGVPDPATIESGMHWLLTASTYAEVAALIGTPDQVDAAWNALVPYADHMVPVAMGAAVWGTVAKPLGHLALRRGHIDEGIAYLRTAVRTCARLGARPWMIDAQLDLADALAIHRPDDPEASALRAEASSAAHQLGLDLFLRRVTTMPMGPRRPEGGGSPAAVPATPTVEGPARPRVRVIGAFEVVGPTGTPARWTSRKARELLKILVTRRGAPISRETLMDLLWPGEDPATVANRLSVALSTVRRALDPGRTRPPGDLISTAYDAVALNLAVVAVDVEDLLDGTRAVLALRPDSDRTVDPTTRGEQPGDGDGDDAPSPVHRAVALLDRHRGEALPDEPHAEWATRLRSEVRMAMISLARLVAADAGIGADPLRAVEAHGRILDLDPYDETAHLGLVAAFQAMGAHGQAEAAYDTYRERMAELGVPAGPRP